MAMRGTGLWITVLLGLLAGLLLDLLTFLVARSGPQGDGWSFRGNGALIVPFGLGPALLAGAWAALVRHSRGDAHWRTWGLGAALVGTALVVVAVAALVLFGPSGRGVDGGLSIATLGWIVVAPLLAGALPVAGRPRARQPGRHVAAGVVFAVALAVGFYADALVVAPGS